MLLTKDGSRKSLEIYIAEEPADQQKRHKDNRNTQASYKTNNATAKKNDSNGNGTGIYRSNTPQRSKYWTANNEVEGGGGVGVRKGGLKTNALPITLFWYNEELLNLSTVASNLIRHLDISNDTPCLHIICYHIQRHQRP